MVSLPALVMAVATLFQCTTVPTDATALPGSVWPKSTGSITSPQVIVVPAGMTFDGKLQTYDRSDIKCKGQKQRGAATAMFIVEPGATLRNVIIGKRQVEGVHCSNHDCTLENVWWNDVCEDALTISGGNSTSIARLIGGGARNAADKIVEHDGAGTVSIQDFFAQDFGKLYRSCGTCGAIQRAVVVTNLYAVNPSLSLVTMNSNYGDVATLTSIRVQTSKNKKDSVEICDTTHSTGSGEPTKSGSGPDGRVCKYNVNDVIINGVSPPSVTVSSSSVASPQTLTAPSTELTPSPASALSIPVSSAPTPALTPQTTPVDTQLPGRVQAPPSYAQPSSEKAAATAHNPRSLNFDTPTDAIPSTERLRI